ncbi:unnamed protein product [Polarella glacialis]|uniref:FYVE-type domain-containing protein n=1 Tax=Polarella glacialis TaxID=89957 RepID=A0A813H2I9_POLGL|nr:unnamed protein product [Polarella glacialis]
MSLRGPAAPKRQLVACLSCEPVLKKRCQEGNVQERMKRVEAFLHGQLEPFVYDPESKLEKTVRLSGHVMTGLKQVSSFIPFGQAALAVKSGYYLVRYGPLILAGNEIMEAFQLLVGLARKLDGAEQMLSSDFFGGLYYTMGEHWGQRGCAPQLEGLEHADAHGVAPHPDRELLLRLRHVTRLLQVSTESTPTDAQRLLRQAMPGAELVQAEISAAIATPSYFLICSRAAKAAYLVLPGTRNPADLATDFNAHEEEVGQGSGHRGMVHSAQWLMSEVSPLLVRLYTEGFRVTVVGHSLGAGVGAFLTLFLRRQISSVFCYGFGTPACVDERLQPALLDCMISVVNRDDMVPRLSVKSVQDLVTSVLCPGQVAKTQAWMKEDWQAIQDMERVVQLRRRSEPAGTATLQNGPGEPIQQSSSSSGNNPGGEQEAASREEEASIAVLVEAGVERGAALRALRHEDGDLSRALLRATEEEVESPAAVPDPTAPPPEAEAETAAQSASSSSSSPTVTAGAELLLGGLRRLSSSVPSWVAGSSSSSSSGIQVQASHVQLGPRPPNDNNNSSALDVTSDAGPGGVSSAELEVSPPGAATIATTAATATTTIAATTNHPQFLVPGQVVHLYRENGLSRAALAEASHESLARIIPSKDMLNDHRVAAYTEALHQACIDQPQAPRWESFDQRKACACCQADFSWAYVLQSEAQKMLSKHNCFACGRVVCEGCSRRRMAHAKLGFPNAKRTCDRCFFATFEGTEEAQAAAASEEAAAAEAGRAAAQGLG